MCTQKYILTVNVFIWLLSTSSQLELSALRIRHLLAWFTAVLLPTPITVSGTRQTLDTSLLNK